MKTTLPCTTIERIDQFQQAIAGAVPQHEAILRLFGIPEAELVESMRLARDAGLSLDELEITTCVHRGEIEVVGRWSPEHDDAGQAFTAFLRERHGDVLFSADGRTVDEIVADLLRERSWRVATAESCTGGLLAGRLTDGAGASEFVAGGVVAYANDVKRRALHVDSQLLSEHGAVSAPVAQAMANGALRRTGADVAVAVTGIAGPDGGTPEKPVGTVFLAVATADGAGLVRHARLPGDRAAVRDRTTTAALHLLRRLLQGASDPD